MGSERGFEDEDSSFPDLFELKKKAIESAEDEAKYISYSSSQLKFFIYAQGLLLAPKWPSGCASSQGLQSSIARS